MPTGVAGITDATAVTAGGEHSCALHEGGTISCWGNNWHGQLGNGQGGTDDAGFAEIENDFYSPLPVGVLGITDATAITTGRIHTCALHRTGAVSCWGDTGQGQLGNGQSGYIYTSAVPIEVVGVVDATAVATGGEHSCALHRGGTVSCWGNNGVGQLGNGQSGEDAKSSVPVQVEGITDAKAITAGAKYSCALHEDRSISCWGVSRYVQLGNGTENSSSVPVEVEGITDAAAIFASSDSCALREDGTISCWGGSELGAQGDEQSGEDADSSETVQVAGITDAIAVTTGDSHSCALHQDGRISCWGISESGRLGNGKGGFEVSGPIEVIGITDAKAVVAGERHTCALHRTGAISCWGRNNDGQLGNGVWHPQPVIDFGG